MVERKENYTFDLGVKGLRWQELGKWSEVQEVFVCQTTFPSP